MDWGSGSDWGLYMRTRFAIDFGDGDWGKRLGTGVGEWDSGLGLKIRVMDWG